MNEQKGFRFVNVGSIQQATHWLAEIDDVKIVDKITPFHHYKVHYNPYDNEYLIRDDEGDMTDVYLIHKGRFVIQETE